MKAVFVEAVDVASGVRTFRFRPERPLRFVAGQFTELYLPHKNPDGRGQKRWFTLSSSPGEELLAITTRLADEPSSFKNALSRLQPGDGVRLAEPLGDFVLPKSPDIPLTFVAVGIGCTPFRSMLRQLKDERQRRPITMFYAGRDTGSLPFKELFEEMTELQLIIKNPPSGWTGGRRGTLTAEVVLPAVETTDLGLIYLAGPEVFVESLRGGLTQAGIASERIVTDSFPGYFGL